MIIFSFCKIGLSKSILAHKLLVVRIIAFYIQVLYDLTLPFLSLQAFLILQLWLVWLELATSLVLFKNSIQSAPLMLPKSFSFPLPVKVLSTSKVPSEEFFGPSQLMESTKYCRKVEFLHWYRELYLNKYKEFFSIDYITWICFCLLRSLR